MSSKPSVVPTGGSFSRTDDERGSWSRTFESELFLQRGLSVAQVSVSFTKQSHTLRGLHSMSLDALEWKLVACVRGEIWDVVVDVREDSPSFGKYVEFILKGVSGDWVLIPPGYAHGFLSLVDDVVVSYTMSACFDESLEKGFRYDEPKFGIKWPFEPQVVSSKDLSFEYLI